MKYLVIKPFKVRTSQCCEKELQIGQAITLPKDKALQLLNEGKVSPAEQVACRVFSDILQTHLWVVYVPEDMKALRGQGITEAVYTNKEIRVLKKLHKEDLQRVQAVKEIFPNGVVEEVINDSMKGE